jgi:hypothetical protein
VAITIAVACIVSATGANAQDAEEPENGNGAPERLILHAHNVGSEYWFSDVPHEGDRNPDLYLPPGATIEVILHNEGSVLHNIYFGPPFDVAMSVIEPGRSGAMLLEIPNDATRESFYWCEPHRAFGMGGAVTFELPEPGFLPAPPAIVALVLLGGLFMVARRWRP